MGTWRARQRSVQQAGRQTEREHGGPGRGQRSVGQAEGEQDSFIESQSAERSALTSFLLSSVSLAGPTGAGGGGLWSSEDG